MSEREQALAQIVALAEQHGLTHEDVRNALAARRAPQERPRHNVLGRVFAYIGGTFVIAGVCIFVGMYWGEMSSLERIVATLGSGLAAMVLAYMTSLSTARQRFFAPLFLIAVLFEPVGLVVALKEFSTGGNELLGVLAVSGVMALQCALLFAPMRRGLVLFFALIYAGVAVSTALALCEVDGELNALITGISYFLVTVAITRSKHEPITPFWFAVSSALIMFAWFEIVEGSVAEITDLVIASGLVYLSTVLRSRTLLAAGTIGLLVYIGYFSGKHFADSVGWPLLLILLGFVMLALGAVAVRINRRFIKGSA